MNEQELAIRKAVDDIGVGLVSSMLLPNILRQHTHFGDYNSMPNALVESCLQNEVAICSTGPQIVLFNSNGVHRGGFVKSGTRVVLQCLYLLKNK